MEKSEYRPRVVDKMLQRKLQGKGAVLIEGAKWCGKTSTGEFHANSVVYMSDPKKKEDYLTYASIRPDYILNGTAPRLIDEWQDAPSLWDSIRHEVDHRRQMGQFILTGSAVPAKKDDISHTGTGRFAWLKMRPMTLWESGDSNGSVSLGELFAGNMPTISRSEIDIQRLAFLVCRGGWPQAVFFDDESIALDQAFDYYDAVVHSDIQRAGEANFNPEIVKRLMRSYSRNQGSQTPVAQIAADMAVNENAALSDKSVNTYINSLRKIFVVEDMPAWNPNLRSKTAIRTSDTRYFVDPSIATAALGIGPGDLLADLNTFGLLFETLCARDLRVFAESLDGGVYHYRDKKGLECDAVVHLRNGSYGLIEIKLGGKKLIDEGAATLNALAANIDTTKMKTLSFKMVLTGVGEAAYKRAEDDVLVVPIGCLKN